MQVIYAVQFSTGIRVGITDPNYHYEKPDSAVASFESASGCRLLGWKPGTDATLRQLREALAPNMRGERITDNSESREIIAKFFGGR